MRYVAVVAAVIGYAAVVVTAQSPFSPPGAAAPGQGATTRSGPKPTGWTRVGPTEPGSWANVAAHPSGAVYLASIGGGVRRSDDFGVTWTSMNADDGLTWHGSGLTEKGAYSILATPGVLYAGTTLGASRSCDQGATWIDADPGLGGAHAFGDAITADPNTEGKLFASTLGSTIAITTDAGRTWQPSNEGISAAIRRGLTWFPINNGITDLIMGRAAPVVLDPENPRVLYVGSERGGGVYKSRDAGASWTPMNAGLDTSVHGLVMDPFRPETVFAAEPPGVYKTLTGGEE